MEPTWAFIKTVESLKQLSQGCKYDYWECWKIGRGDRVLIVTELRVCEQIPEKFIQRKVWKIYPLGYELLKYINHNLALVYIQIVFTRTLVQPSH